MRSVGLLSGILARCFTLCQTNKGVGPGASTSAILTSPKTAPRLEPYPPRHQILPIDYSTADVPGALDRMFRVST